MKRILLFLIMAAALASVCGCCHKAEGPKAKHLFLIGLDGLSSEAYVQADMPFVKSLAENGSYTIKKRSTLPSWSTVNWASMFMGVPTEIHGFTANTATPDTPARVENAQGMSTTVFRLLRDARPDAEIGFLYDWNGIKYVADTLAMSKTFWSETTDPDVLLPQAVEYVATKPDLAAFIFDNPDHVGHESGWCSPEYYEMCKKLDSCVEAICKAIEEAGIMDESIIIVTSDHGGINRTHGGSTLSELEAPFVIYGKNIKKGYCFDDVSMMQYDITATMATALGLEQPQSWTGRPMPVFE
ncbi:MAG: alkaline phosphatase [Bacteroidales bacterium]|nr:alkaline phosphatase [Bacteroidales bacterium]